MAKKDKTKPDARDTLLGTMIGLAELVRGNQLFVLRDNTEDVRLVLERTIEEDMSLTVYHGGGLQGADKWTALIDPVTNQVVLAYVIRGGCNYVLSEINVSKDGTGVVHLKP